jgi:thiamine kinase-like enzyme
MLSVLCDNNKILDTSCELISSLANLDSYYDTAENIFNSFDNIVLCHGDMHYENLIKTDHGINLIDFDFCSLNNPEYDYVNMYEETLIASSNTIQIDYILTYVNPDNIAKLQIYNNIFWMAWVLAKLIYCTKNHVDFMNYLILRKYRLNKLNILNSCIQSSSAHEPVSAVKSVS